MTKRLGAWLTVLVLCLSLCLAGCGEEASHTSGEKEDDRPSLSAVIRKKERHLRNGELREALAVLYDYVDEVGMTAEAEEAIADYFDEVTFHITVQPGDCDETHCFTDTTYDDGTEHDIGLQLIYPEANVTETIARITIRYAEDWQPQDDDITIVGHDGDRWLFYLYSGPGQSSSFLYTIHTNRLKIFEHGLPNWTITDEGVLLGESMAYGAGDETALYAYSWDGTLLYSKDPICGNSVMFNKRVYYVLLQADNKPYATYVIYSMLPDGTKNQKMCTIALSSGSYLALDEGKVIWYDTQAEREEEMPLSQLRDIAFNGDKQVNTAQTKMQVVVEWNPAELSGDKEFQLSVEVTDGSATWQGNQLIRTNGQVIASKTAQRGKAVVNIFDVSKTYCVRVDDDDYAEHLGNEIGAADLTILSNGKTILDDAGFYQRRAYTGYWYIELYIKGGKIQETA